jgi:pimeloyl-ACP methyl ester carboxylesterase
MKNDSVKDIIQKMVLESPGWKWQFNNRQKHFKLDSLNQLRNMKMNTLLVYGEYSPEFYHKAMKTISEYMPNSQIHMLKGSSHFLSLENSNDFNQILYNFMRELKL